MTKKKMPKGRPFPPGQSGNPGGRPKLPEDLKHVKELTVDEVKRLFAKYSRMGQDDLEIFLESPDTPMFEKVIASGLQQAVKHGDYTRLNFILDRTIGKVTEKTAVELPEPVIIKRLSGEEVLLAAAEKKE